MDADVPMPADYSVDWYYAFGGPLGSCLFKSCHEDFLVDELLPFEPEGEGEHLFLLIEKKGRIPTGSQGFWRDMQESEDSR